MFELLPIKLSWLSFNDVNTLWRFIRRLRTTESLRRRGDCEKDPKNIFITFQKIFHVAETVSKVVNSL